MWPEADPSLVLFRARSQCSDAQMSVLGHLAPPGRFKTLLPLISVEGKGRDQSALLAAVLGPQLLRGLSYVLAAYPPGEERRANEQHVGAVRGRASTQS